VLTDRAQAARPLLAVVAEAIAGGGRTVLLREKDLPRPERLALAMALRDLLDRVHGRLIVAGPDPLDGDAVHLSAHDAMPANRPPLVGRSCHSEAELAAASAVDYVTLSPIYPSLSKSGYGPPIGLDGLRRLSGHTPRSVFALGGVETPARVAACRQAGAAGVAVMGAVMRAPDPAAVVAALLSGWDGLCDTVVAAGTRVTP
jgi:thiamine-phosphate diphosphorylase